MTASELIECLLKEIVNRGDYYVYTDQLDEVTHIQYWEKDRDIEMGFYING